MLTTRLYICRGIPLAMNYDDHNGIEWVDLADPNNRPHSENETKFTAHLSETYSDAAFVRWVTTAPEWITPSFYGQCFAVYERVSEECVNIGELFRGFRQGTLADRLTDQNHALLRNTQPFQQDLYLLTLTDHTSAVPTVEQANDFESAKVEQWGDIKINDPQPETER